MASMFAALFLGSWWESVCPRGVPVSLRCLDAILASHGSLCLIGLGILCLFSAGYRNYAEKKREAEDEAREKALVDAAKKAEAARKRAAKKATTAVAMETFLAAVTPELEPTPLIDQSLLTVDPPVVKTRRRRATTTTTS